METKLGTRKRKQPSSNPFTGIFTRSKSQIYLHQNRSGRARSDAIRRRHHHALLRDVSKPNPEILHPPSVSPVINVTPHVSVKDLRARRVFSPGVIDEIDMEVDLKAHDQIKQNPDSNPNFEINDGDPAPNSSNHDGSAAANLSEEGTRSAPIELQETLVNRADHDSILKGLAVLNSRSRRKVFKAPSSFSYRRLLPYLMGTSRDESCVSNIEIVDLPLSCNTQNFVGLGPILLAGKDLRVAVKGQEIGAQADDTTDACHGQSKTHVCHNIDMSLECTRLPTVEKLGEYPEQSNLIEECDQMTPPDADVFGKADMGSLGMKGESVMVNDIPSNSVRNGGANVKLREQRNGAISKPKPVLNPCSRMKLLKTPTSVSYRRLLPFLVEITKDDSCVFKVKQCPTEEKNLEQKPQLPVVDSSYQDNPVGKSVTESDMEKHSSGDKDSSQTPSLTSTDSSFAESNPSFPVTSLTPTIGTSNIEEKSVAKVSSSSEPHIPSDSLLEVKPQLEKIAAENTSKVQQESPSSNLSCGRGAYFLTSLCSTANHENASRECAFGISEENIIHCTGRKTSVDKEYPISLSVNQNLSSVKAFDPSRANVDGLSKGILKRNPRGCRGLCNCLNCASFRLHAERAYEFSRNQMLDAEEVAVELIEELSCLRNMLEKSVVDANHFAIIHGNQLLVKEACRKALHAEELAKKRIGQMNENLIIHCREATLQRPRVSFASKIEEKVIANAGL